jgi:hypothetical protein
MYKPLARLHPKDGWTASREQSPVVVTCTHVQCTCMHGNKETEVAETKQEKTLVLRATDRCIPTRFNAAFLSVP